MKKYARINRESGKVSILTVTLFIMLFSILTVGFSRIMASMSRQVQNDELSARALASAESGVEDAKRILSFCLNNPNTSGCELLNDPIEEQDCDSVIQRFSDAGVINRIDNQVRIGEGNDAQYYLCLQISRLTRDFIGQVTGDGRSVIIPMNWVNAGGIRTPARTVTIEWHRMGIGSEHDGPVNLIGGSAFPAVSQWNGPATIRAELVRVPNNFTINQLVADARAVTLRPTSSPNSGGLLVDPVYEPPATGNAWNIDHWQRNVEPNTVNEPLMAIRCLDTGAHSCSFTFTNGIGIIGGPVGEATHYLRLQAIYRDARFRITARDEYGNQLYLLGTQPEIDVTGRALDAFRRLRARVEPNANMNDGSIGIWWPEYAIESGGVVCKDMSVIAQRGMDNCVYY